MLLVPVITARLQQQQQQQQQQRDWCVLAPCTAVSAAS